MTMVWGLTVEMHCRLGRGGKGENWDNQRSISNKMFFFNLCEPQFLNVFLHALKMYLFFVC